MSERLFESYVNNNFKGDKYKINIFNKNVNNLPTTLTHLVFGYKFNCNVDTLLSNLTLINFGWCFNKDVSKLPHSITHLTFGFRFNQDISNLPQNLTHLSLGRIFNQQCNIPLNIKYLKLACDNLYAIDSLPNSVTELELHYYFSLRMDNLPSSIKKIIIDIDSDYNEDLNCLPDYVEELQLNRKYKKRIFRIPSNLKKLICDKNYSYKDDFTMCVVQTYNYSKFV